MTINHAYIRIHVPNLCRVNDQLSVLTLSDGCTVLTEVKAAPALGPIGRLS